MEQVEQRYLRTSGEFFSMLLSCSVRTISATWAGDFFTN